MPHVVWLVRAASHQLRHMVRSLASGAVPAARPPQTRYVVLTRYIFPGSFDRPHCHCCLCPWYCPNCLRKRMPVRAMYSPLCP